MKFRRWLAALLLVVLDVHAEQEDKYNHPDIERTTKLRTHSVYAPYIDQELQNRWWDFGADAYVNTNKHIRLTRNVPSQMGWLWSRLPLTAHHYVIEVEFKISGYQSHLYGDGLAMWLTTERAKPGPVFGSIDFFNGLGIFIDTYANDKHPYSFPRVSAMLGDSKTPYDQAHDNEAHALAGCSVGVRRTNVPTKIRLTYIRDKSLEVEFQYKAWDQWTPCFLVTNITLPLNPFLGFSAMTGDVHDNHDIISVTSSSAFLAGPSGPARAKLQSTKSSSWGFSFWGLIKLVSFGGICAMGYSAAKTYARRHGGLRVGSVQVLRGDGGMGSFELSSSKRF